MCTWREHLEFVLQLNVKKHVVLQAHYAQSALALYQYVCLLARVGVIDKARKEGLQEGMEVS